MIKIRDIVKFNYENLNTKTKINFINYLDTSNLTNNKIDNVQKLYSNFPSRAKRIVNKNDILISTVRPNLCHFGIIKEPIENMVASTGFTILSVNNKYNSEYIYYLLTQKTTTNHLAVLAEGATTSYPSIRPEDILDLKFDISPDLPEQEKIANVLSKIDKKIELNNKINKELEEMAKTLYNYWFVQFEFPNEEGKPYKSSGGDMEFNKVLGRDVPLGWKIKTLYDISKLTWGHCPPGKNILKTFVEGAIRYSSGAGDIDSGLIANPKAWTDKPSRFAETGQVLMSIVGTIGKLAFVDEKISIGRATLAFEGGSKSKNNFIYLLLSSYISQFNQVSVGAIQKIINTNTIENMKFPLPSNLDSFIENKFDKLFEKMISNSLENKDLIQLRNFLLPLLMNGQVKVK